MRTVTRAVLVAVVLVGAVGQAGPAFSDATFTDAHDGQGSVSAADSFGGSTTADAGGPYTVDQGESVTLDGTGSSTSQGNIKSYSWRITSGPGTLTGADTARPTYNAPSNVDGDTDVTVELTVTDNKGNTDTDTATVTVRDTGSPDTPSVDSLSVTSAGGGRSFDVTADVSDPTADGDSLDTVTVEAIRTKNGKVDYSNTIDVSGDSASVSDTTGKLANNKEYEIRVTVTDASGDSDAASETRQT